MDFSGLPLLCIHTIVEKISNNAYGEREQAHRLCKHAANIALVGNPTFTMVARMLWEVLDSGCTRNARAVYEKSIVEWHCFKENYENIVSKVPAVPAVSVTMENTAQEIKSVCAGLGCKRSGTKAQMLSEIASAVSQKERERSKKIEDLKKRYERAPRMPACFVTQKMRNLVAERRSTMMTATRAKSEYMLSEKDLDKLACTHKKNPHYRSGPPMRLYRLTDLLDAVDEKFGSEKNIALEREKREQRTAKAQATRQLNIARVDTELETAGVDLSRLFAASQRANGEYTRRNVDAIIGIWWRLAELEAALVARGCLLRPDSRLCAAYIDDDIGEVQDIVETMYEMKFLFAHTRYKQIRDEIAERMAEEMIEYDGYV